MTGLYNRAPRARLMACSALASAAFVLGAGGAMAQTSQTVSTSISGDPAILMDDGRTVTIASGVTVTGTGAQRNYWPSPEQHGDAGPISTTRTTGGVVFLGGTNGTVIVQEGATVIGENYGIVTDDLSIVRAGTRPEETMTVENHGMIVGKADDGIRLFNRAVVVNTGTIIGARDLPDPTGPNGSASLGDGISQASTGVHTIEGFDGEPYMLFVENSGEIDGRRMGVIGSGGAHVVNSGTIHGDISGVLLQNGAVSGGVNVVLRPIAKGYLENSGTITANFQNGASVWSTEGGNERFSIDVSEIEPDDIDYFDTYDVANAGAVLLNSGLIETFAEATGATTGYVYNPVTQQQEPVQGQSQFYAFQMISTNGYILNTGTIRAENGANGVRLIALSNVDNKAGVIVLDNQGTIIGSVVGANIDQFGVESPGQEIIRNNGLIDGDVALGSGDDVFFLDANGHVTGSIDLGEGDDLMVWDTKASVGGFVSGGAGDNTLALILGGTGFNASTVFNFQTVQTYGAGNLNEIDLSYVPEIQVNEGATLNIGATGFKGTAYVNNGGVLAGVGQVEAIVIRGQATVSPGNSIGTITVVGDVDYSSATIYDVEVSAVGSDQVLADGEVRLDGGLIVVRGEDGQDLAPGEALDSYLVLAGAGGLSGRFEDIDDQLRFYDAVLAYSGTELTVKLEPVGADFNAAASTANEASIGGVLYDALLDAEGDFLDAMKTSFPGLNADGVRLGLNVLSGPAHALAPVAVSEVGLQVGRAAARSGWAAQGQNVGWVSGLASSLDMDAAAGSVAADVDVLGAAFGVNRGLGNSTNLGVFVGLSSAKSDDAVGGQVESDGWFVGARFATAPTAPITFSGHIGYLSHEAEVRRDIAIGALSRTAAADYDVDGLFYGAEIAWQSPVTDTLGVGLFASISGGAYEGDGFAERGAGSLALSSPGASYDRTSYRLGARFTADMSWGSPRLDVGAQLEDGDRFEILDMSLAGAPGAFRTQGPALEASAPFISIGSDFDLGGSMTASVSYDGVFGDKTDSHSFLARLSFSF